MNENRVRENAQNQLVSEIIKLINDKQNESLKNMDHPLYKEYWFGRSSICSEIIKDIKKKVYSHY